MLVAKSFMTIERSKKWLKRPNLARSRAPTVPGWPSSRQILIAN